MKHNKNYREIGTIPSDDHPRPYCCNSSHSNGSRHGSATYTSASFRKVRTSMEYETVRAGQQRSMTRVDDLIFFFFSVIPSRRLPSTGRRFGANARTTVTTTTTTTSAPSTEATTVAAVTSRRSNSNRFSVLRNKSSTTLSTTTALPVTEEPKSTADSSARSKLFPKR